MLSIIRLLPSGRSSLLLTFTPSAAFATRRRAADYDDNKELLSSETSWQKRLPLRQVRLQRDEYVAKQYSHEGGIAKQYYAPDWDLEKTPTSSKMSPEKWEYNNTVIWPPHYRVPETNLPKAREVFHCLESIKYSPKRMWTLCRFLQGMNVSEALLQLQFIHTKGAVIMTKVIRDAMERANQEFHIEFPTDMHIAEAFAIQSAIIKGQRRHRGSVFNIIRYRYCNAFIRLEEGNGPGFAGRVPPENGWQRMHNYYEYLRQRRIKYSL